MKFGLTFVIATLMACSGSTTPNPVFYAGTYVLVSVDGVLLPANIDFDGGNRYVALSGNTILRIDGSFTKNHLVATHNSADVRTETRPFVYNGSYEIVGSRITFNFPANATDPAHSVEGDIADGVISQTSSSGRSWRFVRQP